MPLNKSIHSTTEGVADNYAPPTKRPRLETDQACEASNISIQNILFVPPEFIFLETQEKPLLTRAEGQCFMRINLLAQGLDALALLAEKILLQRKRCHLLYHNFHEYQNPALRTVTVIASIFEKQTLPALQVIQRTVCEFMIELSSRSSLLRQSAEQNWSVSESLLDAMGGHSSQNLARDKRNLAELEEEISRRIDGLVAMTTFDYQGDKTNALGTKRNLFGRQPQDAGNPWKEPMKNTCSKLFLSGSREEPSITRASIRTKAYTQPEELHTATASSSPPRDTEEIFHAQEESQNSFRKKSSAAEVLANLAVGGQNESIYK